MKRKKVSLDVFEESVLPMLEAKHADVKALQKAIDTEYEIVDGEGDTLTPVKFTVSAKSASPASDGDDADGAGDTTAVGFDQKSLAEMVSKTVAETLAGFEAKRGRNPIGHNRAGIGSIHDNAEEDPTAGFKHFGEFAAAVKRHVINHTTDERLVRIEKQLTEVRQKAPTNYAQEAVGADGGYLVPEEFNRTLLSHLDAEDSLLARTTQLTTNGNTVTIPKDETTPWSSDGVQAYWTGEGVAITDSKPKVGEATLTLHKLTVLVPVTNEMLEDSFIGLGSYLAQKAPVKIQSKVNTAIVEGTGAGQPRGYRSSGALVTVAKETSQTADTVNATNVLKMLSRLQKGGAAAFLYNPTVLPQLGTMTIGNQPVWLAGAARTIDQAPLMSLLGRPTIECQDCNVLGDLGDIDLVDLSKYITVTKTTGLRSDMSMHLYFDRDMTTFRFVFRLAGQPWQNAPITLKDGTTTQSPFVTLAERA